MKNNEQRLVINLVLALGLCCLFLNTALAQQDQGAMDYKKPDAPAYLDMIKKLEGLWSGTYEWTGARQGSGKIKARYYTTGYGSSVIENLIAENGRISMSSTYHLDGNDLRMTHYCAANNYPRLIASNLGDHPNWIGFKLVDITNLKTEKAGHVNGVELKFIDDTHLNIIFHWIQDDKKSKELIQLVKVQDEKHD